MSKKKELARLQKALLTIRDQEVLLDTELAELLDCKTSALLQMVSKNEDRFPKSFAFPVNKKELATLVEKGHLSKKKAASRRKPPLLFTEAGAYMASFLLTTTTAKKLSQAVLATFLEKESLITSGN